MTDCEGILARPVQPTYKVVTTASTPPVTQAVNDAAGVGTTAVTGAVLAVIIVGIVVVVVYFVLRRRRQR